MHANSQAPQCFEVEVGLVDRRQHRGLGHLDDDATRIDPIEGDNPHEVIGPAARRKLYGGHVHADRARHLGVADKKLAHLLEHRLPDACDEPALLGRVEKRAGGKQPSLRVLPPHERLVPDHGAVGKRHDGLVVRHELPVLKALADLGLDDEARHGLRVHRLVSEVPACAPGLLGAVERDVGVAQHARCRRHGRGHRDADRRRRPQSMAFDLELLTDRRADLLGHPLDVADRSKVRHDHDELVAAESSDAIAEAHRLADARGDFADHFIAGGMRERFVDDLEVVEVDEEHPDLALRPLR